MTQLTASFRLVFGRRFITLALGAIVLVLVQTGTAKAQWGTSGVDIYNTNSGNVGVGITAPIWKVDISGLGSGIGFFNGNTATLGANAVLNRIVSRSNYGAVDNSSAAEIKFLTGNTVWYNGQIAFYTNNIDSTAGQAQERMRITNAGNVGIGTTTPAATLDVQGTGYFSSVVNLGHATSFARLGQNLSITSAANYGGMTLSTFSAVHADHAPVMDFNRSKSSTVGAYTAVANDDVLGHIIFRGSTGSAFGDFARISGAVDGATIAAGDNPGRLVFWTTPDGSGEMVERMRITNAGNVGIGVVPVSKFEIGGSDASQLFGRITNTASAGTTGWTAQNDISKVIEMGVRGSTRASYGALVANDAYVYGLQNLTIMADGGVTKFATGGNAERMRIDASGNVGIGTTTPSASYKLDVNGGINASNINSSGNITAAGSIAAKYQDVAEWVPASHALSAGTVVTLDPTKSNHVEASSQAYDTRVAGVVSAQPGITLGEQSDNKVLVATTGRVKVMVDAASGPIQVGDLLVTSDIQGVAKKSEPLLLGGVPIHRPGTLIGKALEPLAKGRGEILVLLSLQ